MSSFAFRLISFADGNLGWRLSGRRFRKSVKELDFFFDFSIHNKRSIKALSKEGRVISKRLKFGTRGYGYWVWKPLILLHELSRLPATHDGIAYIDIGCSFNVNPTSRQRMNEYFRWAMEYGAMSFELPNHIESAWTKSDTRFLVNGDPGAWSNPQRISGVIILKKTQENIDLLSEWLSTALLEDGRYADDSPSILPNHIGFIEHRHDQSIWSLLAKKYGVYALPDETYFAPNWSEDGRAYPIWATRLRSGFEGVPIPVLQRVLRMLVNRIP